MTSASNTSSSPLGTANPEGDGLSNLSTAGKVGILVGIFALTSLVSLLLILCRSSQRRRQAKANFAAWKSGRDVEGIITEKEPGSPSKQIAYSRKSPLVGLAAATFRRLSDLYSSREDPYALLGDVTLARQPTRREGQGIRLLSRKATSRSEGAGRSKSGGNESLRINMLQDEDTRRFTPIKEEEDWVMSPNESKWRRAGSLLREDSAGDDSDPFEDIDPPPFRGGPVPTPHRSSAQLDPFGDNADSDRANGDPIGLRDGSEDRLAPPQADKRWSSLSAFSTAGSRLSANASDAESAIVQQAQQGSRRSVAYVNDKSDAAVLQLSPHTSGVLSPQTDIASSYRPIKRSESFFQRMTGLTSSLSLLRRATRSPNLDLSLHYGDFRDPTPPPTLWPIASRESGMNPPAAGVGPSLTSLASARSMRDAIVMQRDPTFGSDAESEGVIGSIDRSRGPTACSDPDEASSPDIEPSARNRGETPGSAVVDGGAFHPVMPRSAFPSLDNPFTDSSTSPQPYDTLSSTTSPIASTPDRSAADTTPKASPSSVTSMVSHRRPVRDVVRSINRRSAGNIGLFSPTSAYSVESGLSSSKSGSGGTPESATVRYEAFRRGRLSVTNPDDED